MFVKDELVHIAAVFQSLLLHTPLKESIYQELRSRGVDELRSLIRLLMFNPQIIQGLTNAAVLTFSDTATATHAPAHASVTAEASSTTTFSNASITGPPQLLLPSAPPLLEDVKL
jgi:hypothetical protein